MSEDKREQDEAATKAARGDEAPQTVSPPRVLRLGVRTHGSAATTEVYDLDTGEVLHFDGWMHGVLDAGPGRPNRARLVLTFDAPVEVSERVQAPVDIHGFSVGAKQGQPPARQDGARRPQATSAGTGKAIGAGMTRR